MWSEKSQVRWNQKFWWADEESYFCTKARKKLGIWEGRKIASSALKWIKQNEEENIFLLWRKMRITDLVKLWKTWDIQKERNQHGRQNVKTRLWVKFLVLVIRVFRDNHMISSRESFFPPRLILHPLSLAGTRWRQWYGNTYLKWQNSAFCVTGFPQAECHNSCSTSVLLSWIKWWDIFEEILEIWPTTCFPVFFSSETLIVAKTGYQTSDSELSLYRNSFGLWRAKHNSLLPDLPHYLCFSFPSKGVQKESTWKSKLEQQETKFYKNKSNRHHI